MKKELNTVCPCGNIFCRIARELRRLYSGAADRLAEMIDVYVVSNCRVEPLVSWAKALGSVESEGPYGEQEHFAHDSGVRWEDRYAYCSISEKENIVDMDFTTSGGHGLRIVVELPVYDASNDVEDPGSIEVIADDLVSERFWGDAEGDYLAEDGKASTQVVSDRESAFLKALAVDDEEFADREAEARIKAKVEFEKRRSEKSVFPSPETSRRVAAAKAAIEAIKANKAAAEA